MDLPRLLVGIFQGNCFKLILKMNRFLLAAIFNFLDLLIPDLTKLDKFLQHFLINMKVLAYLIFCLEQNLTLQQMYQVLISQDLSK